MGRKRHGADLYIYMNTEKVGVLSKDSKDRLGFLYDEEWLHSPRRRPLSLSLPLAPGGYSGSIVECFFDNLLPDSDRIRKQIRNRFNAKSDKCFDLLWHVGRDCVGAIQMLPEDTPPDVGKVEVEVLNEKRIGSILRSYASTPFGFYEDEDYRISIAGAQEKTALLWHENRWCRPLGATPTSHIFKLPIGHIEQFGFDLRDSVENEWLCHHIFKAYDLPVANADILTFDGAKALAVERFDRRWSPDGSWLIRLPQEDMCQALSIHPLNKYENQGGPGIKQIMSLLTASAAAEEDRRVFMKTLFLFWILAAIDGHGKNFSIFLGPGDTYQLTPGYDILSGHPLMAKKQAVSQKMKMAMAVQGKGRHYNWEWILHRHWLSTAENAEFSKKEMATIIDEILDGMDEVIDNVASLIPQGFPEFIADSIFGGMRSTREMTKRTRD